MTHIIRRLSVFLCMGMISSAAPCFAGEVKPYAEIGLASTNVGLIAGGDHISGLVRGGVELTSWLAVEGEGIVGLENSETSFRSEIFLSEGLDYQLGGYLRLGVPIKKRVLPYIRLGIANAQISDEISYLSEGLSRGRDINFTGPSVGVGLQGFFGKTRSNGVRLDLTVMTDYIYNSDEDVPDYNTTNLSFTYVRRF